MQLFRQRRQPGWVAILSRGNRIESAYVVRNGKRASLKWLRQSTHAEGAAVQALTSHRHSLSLHDGYRCSTLIPRDAYQTFEVPAPKVERSEWRDALRWVVKDSLEFPIDEAMIEVIPIPHEGAPPGRDPMAVVIATPRSVVAERVQLFQRARLNLRVISVANMAQRNAASIFEEPGRGLAFLRLHKTGALLTFTCDASIYATRHLNFAVEDLGDSADDTKRTHQIDRVSLDVQRSLDSFDRQFSHVALRRLVISAPAGYREFIAALRLNLEQTIELADLRSVMDMSACPELDTPEKQAPWMLPIGLALRIDETA